MKLMGIMAGILLYMEIVYHIGCFGFAPCNPVFGMTLILVTANWQALIVMCVRKKWKKRMFWIFLGVEYLLFAIQIVYMGIFTQPLLWNAVVQGGQDALTNYWREALAGIVDSLPFLVLLAVPLIVAVLIYTKKRKRLPIASLRENVRLMVGIGVGIVLAVAVMMVGKYIEADYYEEYSEFYDPLTVAENMGVLTLVQRDISGAIGDGLDGISAWFDSRADKRNGDEGTDGSGQSQQGGVPEGTGAGSSESSGSEGMTGESSAGGETGAGSASGTDEQQTGESGESGEGNEKEDDQSSSAASKEDEVWMSQPQQLLIDFASLKAAADGKETTWLADYMETLVPTRTNEYTGMFEGYNLIFLTAEGFSPYAVREDLTPTLYRLIHSGFDFTNYYVPLWQTSTSDGEYINCTGLIPDGQFSMRKSGSNQMLFTLPRYFASEGVGSMAYHNNSLSYYERHITHNNLGYIYKASKLGDLNSSEWGQYIFKMEHPNAWPASDLEMVQGTVSEYIDRDRFHVYYLTVSGHMNYNFRGNSMAHKNRDAVANLEMSETARAYIACQMELDKALEYLLEQLEAAGKLENTVICLSADHYPYGMDVNVYEELAGKTLSEGMDMYRNNLILWNIQLEGNPIVVDKVCGSMDLVPTLLNLFGFSYDSRLYAGRDIFSDEEGLVIFKDRSFVTDSVVYNRKTKETVWMADLGEDAESYLTQKQQEVKDRYQFSAYILRNDYYARISDALPQEDRLVLANPASEWILSQETE